MVIYLPALEGSHGYRNVSSTFHEVILFQYAKLFRYKWSLILYFACSSQVVGDNIWSARSFQNQLISDA